MHILNSRSHLPAHVDQHAFSHGFPKRSCTADRWHPSIARPPPPPSPLRQQGLMLSADYPASFFRSNASQPLNCSRKKQRRAIKTAVGNAFWFENTSLVHVRKCEERHYGPATSPVVSLFVKSKENFSHIVEPHLCLFAFRIS